MSEIQQVPINLPQNAYSIFIGQSILENPEVFQGLDYQQIAIVTSENIGKYYLDPLQTGLKAAFKNASITQIFLPEGEQHKNQQTLDLIYDNLILARYSRAALLVALGGGIVGDITGFAAASYQRGIDFIQVPTTLLAQVDSSVGGKTGINHRLGKNLIGAFYQPKRVLIDTEVLKTLPERERAAGLAEVVKYGLIRDRDFLAYLEKNTDKIKQLDNTVITEIIARSCQHKAKVVIADEREAGLRATLNLGHTFGHALESLTHYKTYLHGEAVAIGIMMAAQCSLLLGYLSADDVASIDKLLRAFNCPTVVDKQIVKKYQLTPEKIREAMQRDKKVRNDKLKLVLLKQLGEAILRDDVDEEKIRQACAMQLIAA